MFRFAPPRPKRRPSLTPMIDVVFLLLVFFMLASQFGRDAALPLVVGGQGATYEGPPRLIMVGADRLSVNGVAVDLDGLVTTLLPLMQAPDDIVVLRADDTATLQNLVDVADHLATSGISKIAVVE